MLRPLRKWGPRPLHQFESHKRRRHPPGLLQAITIRGLSMLSSQCLIHLTVCRWKFTFRAIAMCTKAAVQDQKAHATQHTHYTHMDSSNSYIAHPHTVTQHTCHGQIDALLFVFGTNPSPKEFRQDDTCNKSFCGHTQHRNGSITTTHHTHHTQMSGQQRLPAFTYKI